MSNSTTPYVFGSVISLIITIIGLIIVSVLIYDNATQSQNVLIANIATLLNTIAMVENKTTEAQVCQALIPIKNAMYESCVSDGNGECQVKVLQEVQLANLTAQIESARANCTNRTNLLLEQIANATNATSINVTVLSTGTANVAVGNAALFMVTYTEKRVVLGNEFEMYGIILSAWNNSVTTSNITTITFSVPLLCFYSDRKPLYDWDAFVFSGGWITSYEKTCGSFIFHTYGTNGTIQQVKNVTLWV